MRILLLENKIWSSLFRSKTMVLYHCNHLQFSLEFGFFLSNIGDLLDVNLSWTQSFR